MLKEWRELISGLRSHNIPFKVFTENRSGVILRHAREEHLIYVILCRSSDKCFRLITYYHNERYRKWDYTNYRSYRCYKDIYTYMEDLYKSPLSGGDKHNYS